MTTSIEVNEELIKEAFRLTNCKTEKELIEFVLQELIRTRKKRNLLDLSGQIQFTTDYDYKALRKNKYVYRRTNMFIIDPEVLHKAYSQFLEYPNLNQ